MRWQVPRDAAGGAEGAGGHRALEALQARFPALADPGATPLSARFSAGEIVDAHGRPWRAEEPVHPGEELWFHRELRPEEVPPVELRILHRDAHLLVLDKPHDMATMPRGAHILSSALVRLRRATGISTLVPLHRLDRRTAGVLAFGIEPEERSAYQQLFARGAVDKEYEARIAPTPTSTLPMTPGQRAVLRDHLVRIRGELTTQVLPGPVNAETAFEVIAAEGRCAGTAEGTSEGESVGPGGGVLRVRLHPRTGRTHQLRVQLAARGAPILGEDLYPRPVPEPELPLQLLARVLAFTDPITGQHREFVTRSVLGRTLAW